METYDLLLKNGILIDPSRGIQATMDVAEAAAAQGFRPDTISVDKVLRWLSLWP